MSTNNVTDDAIAGLVTAVEYTAPDDNLWQWLLYAILGAGNVVTNLPILLLFVVYPAFREKEYLLVVALCFGDTLNGIGYCAAGISRSWHVVQETHNDKVSSLDCMLTIHNILWIPIGSYLFAALIMLCISVDRIASGTNWVADQNLILTIVTALSVGNYLIVMIIGRRYYSKAMAALTAQQAKLKNNLELQRRLTISLGMSSGATFVFACVPYSVCMVLEYMRWNHTGRLVVVMWIMTLINPLFNILIYYSRHWQIRWALRALLKCKHLPANTRLWAVNVPPAQTQASTSAVSRF